MERIIIPIFQIGSSKEIKIPKRVPDKLGMKNEVVATINDNSITLSAPTTPRAG